MITFLYVVYVFVCMFLILVVLLQQGKGGMGAAFGGSSQTVFGASGAGNFLTRLTVVCAALFMILSATLAYMSSGSEKALERAADRLKAQEEARKLDTKAATPAPAEQSTPEGDAPTAAGDTQQLNLGTTIPGLVGADGQPIKLERVDPSLVPNLKLNDPTAPAQAAPAVPDAAPVAPVSKPAAKKSAPVEKPAARVAAPVDGQPAAQEPEAPKAEAPAAAEQPAEAPAQ